MAKMQFDIALKLQKLFSVQFLHNFYDDLHCRDFTIVPTRECAEILDNYYLTFKPLSIKSFCGFMVFYDPVRTSALMEKEAWRPQKLSFMIINENQRFYNFSALPFLRSYQACYFSNLKTLQRKPNITLLHEQEYFNADQLEVFQLCEPRFTHEFQYASNGKAKDKKAVGVAYEKIKVVNALGEEIALGAPNYFTVDPLRGMSEDEDMISQALKTPRMEHAMNLSHVPRGKYTIDPGDKAFETTTVYTQAQPEGDCLAMIDIFLQDDVPEPARLYNTKAKKLEDFMVPQNYMIHFDSRATYWRYYLINPRELPYSDHEIANKGKGDAIKFDKPTEVYLRDRPMEQGTPATVLTSSKPISLRQKPQLKMELNMKRNGKGKTTTMKLPTPRVDTVKADREDAKKMYSDVYVYI